MKNVVFVQCADGSFIQHGPVRKSEAQAAHVAKLLARKLGWYAIAAETDPGPDVPADDAPSVALASLSPVWKDPVLAAKWTAAK